MFANSSVWLVVLADVSVKAFLLALLAAVGLRLFGVSNTHARHRVWTAVLFGMLLLPLLVKIIPGLAVPIPGLATLRDSVPVEPIDMQHFPAAYDVEQAGPTAPRSGLNASMSPLSPAATAVRAPSSPHGPIGAPLERRSSVGASALEQSDSSATGPSWQWSLPAILNALLATYLCITALLIVRLLLGILRTELLMRSIAPIPDDLAGEVVWESSSLRVPITVGFFNPRIVLPHGWRAWSRDKLEAVLEHERTHIARRDYAVNLLAQCNRCLYWFHPLSWWLIRCLSDLAEQSCDDAVIASTGDRTSYARHLLEIAATVVEGNPSVLQPGVSMARSADVEMRITAILDQNRPLSQRLGWKSSFCLVAMIAPVFWLAAALRAEAPAPPERAEGPRPAIAKEQAVDQDAAGSATVTGRVVDDEGRPVSNAALSLVLYSHEPQRDRDPAPPTTVWATTQSADDGGFTMKYPAIDEPDFYTKRAYRLVAIASKEGLAMGWKYVKFSDNMTETEIKLSKEHVRRGRLVGLEGQAVAGATVHVVGVGKPAPKWTRFMKYPFHDGMPVDETTDTNIPVDKKGRLWPHLIRFREPPFAVRNWLKSVTSDKNGMFEIRGVGADEMVVLHVYGTDKGGSKLHRLRSDSETKPTTLLLDAPRTITGVVTDKLTGKPVVGAKVRVDGTVLITAKMPIVADWKGRQDHVGNQYALQSNNSEFDGESALAVTDEEGRYRISAFAPRYGQPNFVVSVASPDDQAYLSSRKWISWPRKTTFVQQVDLQLTPGVRVTGQVLTADGLPVPRARIDFWSRVLPYPYKDLANGFPGGFKIAPDGVQHPHWRKADRWGRFEMIVPHGESYLFVNQGTDETIVDRVAATDVGMPEKEARIKSPIGMFLVPRNTAAPHRFYPDRAVRLEYAADATVDDLTVQLNPKAPTLTVEVVNPDGSPAKDLTYMAGQPPFRYYVLKLKRLIQKIGENRFSIPCRDLSSPISLAFLSQDRHFGLHQEIAPEDVGDEVVRLTLQPLGQAKARFVAKDGEPIAGFRPLLWMSIPRKPVSTAADLEQQTVTTDERAYPLQQSFDSVWTSRLLKKSHGWLTTDADGYATFRSLIPNATYRLSQFDGRITDFTVQAGQTVDLGDVTILEPERTRRLPGARTPKVNAGDQ